MTLWEGLTAKSTSWWRSIPLRSKQAAISPSQAEIEEAASMLGEPAGSLSKLDDDGRLLRDRIRLETARLNRNNVTRTAAYFEMYSRLPELHWALLAHLVSRNGGWSMTDLRGEWLPNLLAPSDADLIFRMLETCNALIFHDAYPQLLLYEESRRLGRPLFGLLPHLGVTAFMRPFWELFWKNSNPIPLTVSLVVNEQNVIEKRAVQDPLYREEVLHSFAFRLQPLLQLNQLLFPLHREKKTRLLAGRVLERFDRLEERIEFGKDLYSILFGYPKVLARALAFAGSVKHTGSRADYWPHMFTPERPASPRTQRNGIAPGFSGNDAASGSPLWYSPRLTDAWADQPLGPVSEGDWFQDRSVLDYLKRMRRPFVIDMTREHLFGQRKLQAAVRLAKPFHLNGR
ncbi:DUF2515 family protein [Cohnella sp. AR92]|uniref:DUF2515 family protein n=1 Tax=Cohnella sp. AR92 TaxID=648716 RepID=UPI000F8EA65B|nr:DUF2515 family protein [Cohnella sp. AR92]RUS45988.1 DUF2515 domain-containing protein [Cohnella sp. AR92]